MERVVELGGKVGEGYLGGGEWTGKEFEKADHYLSYGEINKIVKRELTKRFPMYSFKTRGQSYSVGQSSCCYIQMKQEDLFIDRETAIKKLMENLCWNGWHGYVDEDGQYHNVWGEEFFKSPELIEKCCAYRYDDIVSRYSIDCYNVPEEMLTEKAKEVYTMAKDLYLSFIHDETNSMVDYFDRNLYDDYKFCNLTNIDKKESWEV